MDQTRFNEAEQAYEAGDYRTAAKLYLAAAGRGSEGNGVCYHRAGNCLMKLRREHDAVTVYTHALKDESYGERGAVWSNLGRAWAAQAAYSDAVDAYAHALEEPDYEARYKALQGMGGALWEMGRLEDAARAYRKAALEGENPDPGKALNNLGLCFMEMGRATDAVESFRAALGLDTYTNKGRAQANLGLAYAAVGKPDEAVRSFEKAIQLYGYSLSDDAAAVYAASREAATPQEPPRQVVEGWETGDLSGAAAAVAAAESGPAEAEGADTGRPAPGDPGTTGSFGSASEVEEFFARTDDDMRELDKQARRVDRAAKRGDKSPWAVVAVVAGAAFLIASLLVAAYYLGLGWPTQRMTVQGMMDTYAAGKSVDSYWVAVPPADIKKEMQKVSPNYTGYSVEAIDRSPSTSKVDLTVTPQKGAAMHYVVTLFREGAGWKVTGIENDWRSTGGS